MVSFDIESLFTNVPVNETRDLITNKLFSSNQSFVHGLNREQFSTLLKFSTDDTIFLFNNTLYSQIEGMAMGSPLGPSFANTFLSHHETSWINDCPSCFKPLIYRRYVDDCFAIFQDRSHAHKFLHYLNNKHPNIKFTLEEEKDNSLSFLDINLEFKNGSFITSVYRKSTTTLLGTSYFSSTPFRYILSSLRCKVDRGFRLCSNWIKFDEELNYLKKFFNFNLYPEFLIHNYFRSFLNKKFKPIPLKKYEVSKLQFYLTLPYIGPPSSKLNNDILNVINSIFPYIDFKCINLNTSSLSKFFKFKEPVPFSCVSKVVYKFTCANCNVRYVGQTGLQLQLRAHKHLGLSHRTSLPLNNPEYSAIRSHSTSSSHPLSLHNFSILTKSNSNVDRKILESLYISNLKPELNETHSSFKLKML